MRAILLCLTVLFLASGVNAQTGTLKTTVPDSILEKKHSPTKATIMSACLPGLGQIYNHKYWKVPIIYAGFGVLTYLIVFNTNEYLNYQCAYIEKNNGTSNGNYKYLTDKYTADELLSGVEYYRRNLEISVLVSALWYALNIIDATVDAHLFTYNINKELSLRVGPAVINRYGTPEVSSGIRLCLDF
ncbi:MAG TPA: DUF5683 domain-containing protein [Bacteroidales bacterium]|nr:DUF5683 domain-containing protein [Bacteroidales bacterium]